MRLSRFTLAVLLATGTASASQAAFLTGSRSFATDGITLNGTNDLNAASSFNFAGTPMVTTTATGTGALGAVLPENTPATSVNPFTISFTGAAVGSSLTTPFVVAFPQGSVSVASGGIIARGSSFGSNTVGFSFAGTLSFAGYDPTPGVIALSFTQAGGAGNAVSGSGTFAALPTVATPAPSTALALLTALPLLGIARRLRPAAG